MSWGDLYLLWNTPSFITDLGQAHEGGKVVSFTPLRPGNIPNTHFCYGLSRPQAHRVAGRI